MIWSCDPNDIPPWSTEEEEKLDTALDKIFSPKETNKPVDVDTQTQ